MNDNSDPSNGHRVDPGHARWAFGALAAPVGAILVFILGIREGFWWPPVVAALWAILVVLAILGVIEPASRGYIAGTLRKTAFTQVYTFATKRRLDWLWNRLCDPVEDGAGPLRTFRAALSWRLYDWSLLIAVVYPILLFLGLWILTGARGTLGGLAALPATAFWPYRGLTLAGLAAIAVGLGVSWPRKAHPKLLVRLALVMLPLGGVGVTIIAVLAASEFFADNAAPSDFAVASMLLLAVVGSLAILAGTRRGVVRKGASAAVMSLAVAVAIAGAPYSAILAGSLCLAVVEAFERRGHPGAALAVASIGILVALPAAVVFLPLRDASNVLRAIFLFGAVLPFLNALFDAASYAVTLTLIRLGLRARLPLLYGLLDLGVALFLFLALGATLTIGVAGMNRIAGAEIFDLGALFAGLHTDPHAYWWLYLMVFSTILPTALHGALSLIGAQGIVPRFVRLPVARLFAGAPDAVWKAALGPIAVGTVWLVPFLAVGAILRGFWWISADALAVLGSIYLDTLLTLALRIGAF